jgi:hypothetical protein
MSDSTGEEEWRPIYDELSSDADEIFANKTITAVARQRLSNHGVYDSDKVLKNAEHVRELRNARQRKLTAKRAQEPRV